MDIDVRLKVLSRMAQSETEAAKATIEKETKSAALALEKETDYTRLENALTILKCIGFRQSNVATSAVIAFMGAIESRDLTYSEDPTIVALLTERRTSEELLVRSIETLVAFRYLQTASAIHALIPLSVHGRERIRQKAINGLVQIAKYDIDIFYGDTEHMGIGSGPQQAVLHKLERFRTQFVQSYLPAVLTLLKELLSPEMHGSTWSAKSITLTRRGTPPEAGIPSIRSRSIELLKEFYSLANTAKERLHVITVLTTATRTAGPGLGDNSREMFVRDSKAVLAFFAQLADTGELVVVQKIEHNSYWIFCHAIHDDVRNAAIQVEAAISRNSEYQVFRTLIGFEGIFGNWSEVKEREFDPSKIEEMRKGRARDFVAGVTETTYSEWRTRILKYAQVESDDLATFPVFYYFLEKFAVDRPDLALRLLSQDSEGLKRFLIPLFRGLWNGPRKQNFRDLLVAWIERGKYLYAATKQFLSNDDIDMDLLKNIFSMSLKVNDLSPIREMVSVAISNYDKGDASVVHAIMLPALEVLTKNCDASWIYDAWYRKEIEDVVGSLDEGGRLLMLSNISVLRKIDHHAERVLAFIAKKQPEMVLEMLLERLRREGLGKSGENPQFEAIPFELHELREPLSAIPKVAVAAVREQYDGNYGMFVHRGARLLKIIFPKLPSSFENELFACVKASGVANLEFVLAVLRNYEGSLAIKEIAKEIVKSLPSNSPLRSEVAVALESTGVVSGEFGMAEAYERKKTELAGWLDDSDEKVRVFAKQYIEDVQAMSSAERKRAQEEIELRKFKYGEK